MSKVLVTYFSASGVTRGVAQNIADSIGAGFIANQINKLIVKS